MSLPRPSEPFDGLAPYYDAVMAGVPYRWWVDYVLQIAEVWGGGAETVLDLACGTASVGLEFARRGSRVVALDRAPAMLAVARRKQRRRRRRVALVRGDMRRLPLQAGFDLVVCLFDSLNYVLTVADLQDVCRGVAGCLHPRGLFVFDVNTELAFERELFTQTDLDWDSPMPLRWRSCYDRANRLTEVEMEFYPRDGATLREIHVERAHSQAELSAAIAGADLECLAVYDAYTLDPGHRDSERLYYVCRKAER